MHNFDKSILKLWLKGSDLTEITCTTLLPISSGYPHYYIISRYEEKYLLKVSSLKNAEQIKLNNLKLRELVNRKIRVLLPIMAHNDDDFVINNREIFELFAYYPILGEINPPFHTDQKLAQALADSLCDVMKTEVIYQEKPESLLSQPFISDLTRLVERTKPNQLIPDIFLTLQNNLNPYLDQLEISLIHGDFHPGNLLFDRITSSMVIIDWEYSRAGYHLYDLAFFTGCLGLIDHDLLRSDWFCHILQIIKDRIRPSRLAVECLVDIMIAIRLHWLHLWLSSGDMEAIDIEMEYIQFLVKNRTDLVKIISADLLYQSKEKWIIADAVFDKKLIEVRQHFSDKTLTLATLANYTGSTDVSVDLFPQLLIAFGKENNIKRVIDIVKILIALISLNDKNDPRLQILTTAAANASLDLAKNRQLKTMLEIMQCIENLILAEPDNCHYLTILSYILRNSFVMYDQLQQVDSAALILSKIQTLSEANPQLISVLEEYARVLSNAVTSAMARHDLLSATCHHQKLKIIYENNNNSSKIKSAWTVSVQNINQAK